MTTLLRARRVLTEQGWLDDHQLRIENETIVAIEPIPAGTLTRDAELLCPAYIDIHVHGGDGVDVMDDDPGVLERLAIHKAREGVGGWLAAHHRYRSACGYQAGIAANCTALLSRRTGSQSAGQLS